MSVGNSYKITGDPSGMCNTISFYDRSYRDSNSRLSNHQYLPQKVGKFSIPKKYILAIYQEPNVVVLKFDCSLMSFWCPLSDVCLFLIIVSQEQIIVESSSFHSKIACTHTMCNKLIIQSTIESTSGSDSAESLKYHKKKNFCR